MKKSDQYRALIFYSILPQVYAYIVTPIAIIFTYPVNQTTAKFAFVSCNKQT